MTTKTLTSAWRPARSCAIWSCPARLDLVVPRLDPAHPRLPISHRAQDVDQAGARPWPTGRAPRATPSEGSPPYPRPMTAIRDEAALRDVIGQPTDIVKAKLSDRINELIRGFIERSPFVCVATARPDGGLDVSPRGDPPGFVRVLDEHTLLMPERPGNRLADTLTNLLHDPRIALLFLIPGVGDTFRVNGRAEIIDDPDLLADSAVHGRLPRLGLLITVQEAYTQCSKALIRSDLWNPEHQIERSELPSHGEILRSLTDPSFDVETHDRERAARYARREGLY
jgi:PPOX class probable FMN-dependent enzyme